VRDFRSGGYSLLIQMDDCITNAFDKPAKAALQVWQFGNLGDRMIDCTHMPTEQLYGIISHFGDGDQRSTGDPFGKNIWEIQGEFV
jgi:hypothetical protein